MKKIIFCLTVLTALLCLISCEAEKETATLRVELNDTRRTIKPEEENLEIYGYRITALSPDGKESDPYYTYYSYINLDGLNVGRWTIKVYGFNSERKDLIYGESEVSLIAGKNTIAVSLNSLVGEGDLSLKLDWQDSGLEDVKEIHTVFKSQSGKEIILSPTTPANGQSTIKYTNLPSGSYTLQIALYNSRNEKLYGVTEAIRITNNTLTEGLLLIMKDKTDFTSTEATISISDKNSLPVEVGIIGIESLIEAGKSFTVAISVPSSSKIREKDLNTVWYLDDDEVGYGSEYTFSKGVKEGTHNITALTSTGEEGSVGSTTFQFYAASTTTKGEPYQKITISDGEKYPLGRDCVIHYLPNNYILAASNQYRKVSLMSVEENTVKTVASYSYDELKIGEYSVQDFATSGSPYDSWYSVVMLCNSTSSCKAISMRVSKSSITYTMEETNFDTYTKTNKACRFVNIVKGNNSLVATIENTGKTRMGFVLFFTKLEDQKMVNREEYVSLPSLAFGYSGFKALASVPDAGYCLAISAERAKVVESLYYSDLTCASYAEYFLWVNFDDYYDYYIRNETKNEYQNAYGCGFLSKDGKYAFVLSEEGIYYYKLSDNLSDGYEQYHFEEVTRSSIASIKMCNDVSFGYMIESASKRLITLTPKVTDGSYYLERGCEIALDATQKYDTLDISPDGRYLLVYDKSNGSTLAVFKISR